MRVPGCRSRASRNCHHVQATCPSPSARCAVARRRPSGPPPGRATYFRLLLIVWCLRSSPRGHYLWRRKNKRPRLVSPSLTDLGRGQRNGSASERTQDAKQARCRCTALRWNTTSCVREKTLQHRLFQPELPERRHINALWTFCEHACANSEAHAEAAVLLY